MDFQFKILSASHIKEMIPLMQKLTEHKFSDTILCRYFFVIRNSLFEILTEVSSTFSRSKIDFC